MKKFFEKFSKKVVTCPGCSKQLRIPIRPGKTLRVSCPRCHGQFDLSFKSPLGEVFKWDRRFPIKYNLKNMLWKYQVLPGRAKFSVILFVVMMSYFVTSIGQFAYHKLADKKPLTPVAKEIIIDDIGTNYSEDREI